MDLTFDVVQMKIPEQSNIIVGQSHFIKTVEERQWKTYMKR